MGEKIKFIIFDGQKVVQRVASAMEDAALLAEIQCMVVLKQKLGCALVTPQVINDPRGKFTVPFSIENLHSLGLPFEQVYQLNHSFTNEKGTLRGPNYQDPFPQAKIIRCVRGSLYSVGICLEGENKGKWVGFELSSERMEEMYIPRGYAHGFITLEDNTELEYITDNRYCYEGAKSIKWDALGIDWTVGGRVLVREDLLSEKNRNAPRL